MLLDHSGMDWSRVKCTAYLLHQRIRYEYPAPIADLRHRLVIVPPGVHGDQRRVLHRVEVAGAPAETSVRLDELGNHIVDVSAPLVREFIEFEAWVAVQRTSGAGGVLVPAPPSDRRFLDPTPLTFPDRTLAGVARWLSRRNPGPLVLARSINRWVNDVLEYAPGATDVGTTAAEALALGRGVCQDYAHVMVAVCRLAGLAARYVSGHLLGEGASHAWVEVLLPVPGQPGHAAALPFDPTHAAEPGLDYLTVAVGRDYADVAPTSGTFRAVHGGQLSASQHVGLTAVEYLAA
jgi:transglutaminase-like putative cysteine protease